MATKNAALRNKMSEDFGVLFNSGTLKIRNSSNAVLCTFNLNASAFGAASAGKISAAGLPKQVQATGAGTAHNAILESSGAATYVLSGLTVGTTASNVIIDNTSIEIGQYINLTQFDWTESDGIV
jgi:hypothetical protein